MNHISITPALIEQRTNQWSDHEFYRKAVVLGLDIGLEGIGIYLRQGVKEVYARTLDFELPEAEALKGRRQKRAWRHCRKNRKTRLHRLKLLFAKHGLPWLSEERMSRALPFRERLRAVTKGVASPEALSICIRHCVMRRGFDYGGTEEGRFPWGDSAKFSDANNWLASACITPELARYLESLGPELVAIKNVAEQEARFYELIQGRLSWSEAHDIRRLLEEHCKGGHDNLRSRARGFNFPRQKVWEHLEEIVRRHAHFIPDVDGFLATLGIDPNKETTEKAASRARKRAIFFYNRKTRFDMERHWRTKVNVCPFARRLALRNPEARCDVRNALEVRRWSALEFAATRRVELDIIEGKGKSKTKRNVLHRLSAETVKGLVELVTRHDAALKNKDKAAEPKWEDATEIILKDVAAVHGDKVKPSPQTQSEWNKSFFTQLKDLVLPTMANRMKRATLCSESAEKLFSIATAGEMDFTPEKIVERLKAAGVYDWRRNPGADYNPYPQVECLLGRRIKRGERAGALSPSHRGLLRKIFAEHTEELNGLEAPDYCVIEVIGDPPRNTEQKKEIQKEMAANRERRQKLFEGHDLEDHGVASKRRRIQLHHQQHGRCPFTGEKLPTNPLDPNLELEHLFPEEMGGLSVDDNLVLTWRTVNAAKGKRTPLQIAQAGPSAKLGLRDVPFLSWSEMLRNTADMKWGGKKRGIFGWGTNREEHFDASGNLKIPDFGNTTRVAQLARQLRAEVARWMLVENDPDEAARRIGTPSGWLAAQARKSWLSSEDYKKIRSNLVHHLIDAAVLAHIPPREGMNHITCGGIFYTEWQPVKDSSGATTHRLLTQALPGLSPAERLKHWFSDRAEYAICPVMKLRGSSTAKSLGDDTFWRQINPEEATVAQRTSLEKAINRVGGAEGLHSVLQGMRINHNKRLNQSEEKTPSRDRIERWLAAKSDFVEGRSTVDPGELKLADGTPIRSIWKFDSKGTLASPLGWSGRRAVNGKLRFLRSLSLRYDRIEVWLGYDHEAAERARKKKNPKWKEAGWVYQKRKIPDGRALQHLKQLGFSFARDRVKGMAPDYMQSKAGEKKSVREIILESKLLPFSKKMPRSIRKGDLFLLRLSQNGEIITGDMKPFWSSWYRVTATGDVIEMKSAVIKPGGEFEMPPGLKENVLTRKVCSAAGMALLLGSLPAAEQAAKLGLRIPVRPQPPTDTAKEKLL